MNIPTKKQVNSDVAENRRRQIQDGLSLAKKVDELREELLGLQRQRTNYLEQTRLEAESQIDSLTRKRDSLEKEVKLLRDEKQWLTTLMNKMKTLSS